MVEDGWLVGGGGAGEIEVRRCGNRQVQRKSKLPNHS